MADSNNAQATLDAAQVKTGQIRDANEVFSTPFGLTTLAKTAKAKRDANNHYVLREEYLTDAGHMMEADLLKQGYKLPVWRVSLSKANAKRTIADKEKPYAFNNSKTWGALVTVQVNIANEYEIFINNEIEDTQATLAAFYAALLLTIVGPTHYTDPAKKAKFPNGELTFKSDSYDELANKLGILGKYRGNLVFGKSDSLSRILIKIQDALGPCPITPILVDQHLKTGLKQESTNRKAVCKNQLCDFLKEKDSKGATNKPFSIANISAFTASVMERIGAKLPCPICNPEAKADGSFLVLIDPKAEAEAKHLAKAQAVIDEQAAKAKLLAETKAAEQAKVEAEAAAIAKHEADKAAALAAMAAMEAEAKAKAEQAKAQAEAEAKTQAEQAPIATVIAANNIDNRLKEKGVQRMGRGKGKNA